MWLTALSRSPSSAGIRTGYVRVAMSVVRIRRVLNTVRISGPRRTAALVLERVAPTAAQRLSPVKTVSPDALRAQLESILRAWGMPDEHASITAGHMLYADLR